MAVIFKELCIGVNYSFKVSPGPYKTMASYVNVYVFSQSFGSVQFAYMPSFLICLTYQTIIREICRYTGTITA